MKRLISLIAILAIALVSVQSDTEVTVLTANTASNVLNTPKIIEEVVVTSLSSNVTTLRFYDSSTNATTYVQAAYGRIQSYPTNFAIVFTNESGVIVTNDFRGIWTGPVSVSASTGAIPVLQTIIVPGNAQRTRVVNWQTLRGLTVVPNQNAIVEVTYRNNP